MLAAQRHNLCARCRGRQCTCCGEGGSGGRGVESTSVLKAEGRACAPLSLDDFLEAPPPGGRGARRCSPAKADQRLRRPHTSDDMHTQCVASDSR